MPSKTLLRTVIVLMGTAGTSAFAPAPVPPTRGLGLRMQMATPPPPQPVVMPMQQQVAIRSDVGLSGGRFEERVSFGSGMMLAHGGGHEGGADIPYKLMKVRENKLLHMSEEDKMEEEKTEKEKKVELAMGIGKLAILWAPVLYFGNYLRTSNVPDKIGTIYQLIFLLSVPLMIVASGWVFPDTE